MNAEMLLKKALLQLKRGQQEEASKKRPPRYLKKS